MSQEIREGSRFRIRLWELEACWLGGGGGGLSTHRTDPDLDNLNIISVIMLPCAGGIYLCNLYPTHRKLVLER